METSTLAWLSGGVFAGWLALTIAFQFKRCQVRMRAHDPFYMLPSWTFFAPVPNTSDFVFVCRYEANGVLTTWQEPRLFAARSFPLVWDPARRQQKTIIDISQSLAEFVREGERPDLLHLATPYLLLLHFASTRPEAVFANRVQVALGVRPQPKHEFELFFLSHLHPLDAAMPLAGALS